MKVYFLNILLLLPILSWSQVGIGTTAPHTSSKLDISSTNKGILVPRVNLTDLNIISPITTATESVLVYNTNIGTGKGFYFWNGTKWTRLANSSATTDTDWIISGDDMSNGNTNFIGIGTNTPTSSLHIEDTTNKPFRLTDGTEASGKVLTSDQNGFSSWETPSLDNDWTVSGNNMYNSNSGTVNIGSTIPNTNTIKFTAETNNILLSNSGNAALSSKSTAFTPDRSYEVIGTYTDTGYNQNAIYIGAFNQNNISGFGYDDTTKIYCGKNLLTMPATLPITATAFNVASSKHFKKNIETLSYGLKDLLKIEPVKYQYKNDVSNLYTIGFIAEQVSNIIPEIITFEDAEGHITSREKGKPVSMDYSKMNAIIINSIKEQQIEINRLETENTEIEKQINTLENWLFNQ